MKALRAIAALAAGWGLAALQHAENGPFDAPSAGEAAAWMAFALAIAVASMQLKRAALGGAEVAVAVLGLVGIGWAAGGEFTSVVLLTAVLAAPAAYALDRWRGVTLLPLALGIWFVVSFSGYEPHATLAGIGVAAGAAGLMSRAHRGFAV